MKYEVKGLKIGFEIGSIEVAGVTAMKDLVLSYNLEKVDFACEKGELKDFMKSIIKVTKEAMLESFNETNNNSSDTEDINNTDTEDSNESYSEV